jgi:hypothetical protein
MKKPKILRYTWEDLTGTEEIGNYFIDEIRRTLLCIKANRQDRHFLQALFERQCGYILACPASDFCVILYRLLEPIPVEILKTCGTEEGLTVAGFIEFVNGKFVDKPMPIVAGEVPGLNL